MMKAALLMIIVSTAGALRAPVKQNPKKTARKAVGGGLPSLDFDFKGLVVPTPDLPSPKESIVTVIRKLPGGGTDYGRPTFEAAQDIPRTSPVPEPVALLVVATGAFLPILAAGVIVAFAPGNQLPFNFLDKYYAPRVAELKRESDTRDRIAAEAKAKSDAAKAKAAEAEAKAKAEEKAKADAAAAAKAKAEGAKPAPAAPTAAAAAPKPAPVAPKPAPPAPKPKAVAAPAPKASPPKASPTKASKPDAKPAKANTKVAASRAKAPKTAAADKKDAPAADKELSKDEAMELLKKYSKSENRVKVAAAAK